MPAFHLSRRWASVHGQIGLLLLISATAAVLTHRFVGPTPPGWLANTDFANYWIAARLILDGQVTDVFGPHAAYFSHMQAAFGEDYPWHVWSYPPHYLLLIWPVGLLSYPAAMAAFLSLTAGLYLLAVKAFSGRLDAWLLALLLPFAAVNVLAAQNGFLTGSLMLAGLAWRQERPVLSGVAFGLLTVKPQLGLLLPLLLIAERRWSVIGSALATSAAVLVLSLAVFGVDSWLGFVEHTVPYQRLVMDQGTGIMTAMMLPPFGSLRVLGLDGQAALPYHVASALPALGLALLVFFRSEDRLVREAVLLTATFLVTPFALVYDMGAFVAAIAAVVARTAGAGRFRILNAVLLGGLLLPVLTPILGLSGLPITPLMLWAVLLVLVQRAGLPSLRRFERRGMRPV